MIVHDRTCTFCKTDKEPLMKHAKFIRNGKLKNDGKPFLLQKYKCRKCQRERIAKYEAKKRAEARKK